MIKVNGHEIENIPYEFRECSYVLLEGVVNSQSLHFLKTPLKVYGRNENEIIKYANSIKEQDSSYDIIELYSEYDEDDEKRNYIKSLFI